MGKIVLASFITFVIAIFTEALLREEFNVPGIGIMFAVSVMGGFIVYFNEKKNNSTAYKNKISITRNNSHPIYQEFITTLTFICLL